MIQFIDLQILSATSVSKSIQIPHCVERGCTCFPLTWKAVLASTHLSVLRELTYVVQPKLP